LDEAADVVVLAFCLFADRISGRRGRFRLDIRAVVETVFDFNNLPRFASYKILRGNSDA
jgi:hypothetical protein